MNKAEAFNALNRLAKWRVVFTGWQLGTRLKGDAEGDAVRDHREVTILLRAEVSALVGLLAAKGVFTLDEWTSALGTEAELLALDYARRFPGLCAVDDGIEIYDVDKARQTTKGWRP